MTTLERLAIVLDATQAQRGAQQFRRATTDVTDGARRAESAVSSFGRQMVTFASVYLGARTLRAVGSMADSVTNLRNRLRLVTDSVGELNRVQDRLVIVSQQTRSSIESNAEVFNRLSLALPEAETEELLRLTESLNKAVAISGATATEAQAGLIQLSQGLASGALRGDELRSVLEQLPAVARVIASSLGVSVGKLRDLGSEGKLTADVIRTAFADAATDLDSDFEKVEATLEGAFTQVGNALAIAIGRINEASGATDALIAAIQRLSGTTPGDLAAEASAARTATFNQAREQLEETLGLLEFFGAESKVLLEDAERDFAKFETAIGSLELSDSLEEVGAIEGLKAIGDQAARLREELVELQGLTSSFDGEIFRDNAFFTIGGEISPDATAGVQDLVGAYDDIPPAADRARRATEAFKETVRGENDSLDRFIRRLEDQRTLLEINDPILRAQTRALQRLAEVTGGESTEAYAAFADQVRDTAGAMALLEERQDRVQDSVEEFDTTTNRLADGLSSAFTAAADGADNARESIRRLILEMSRSQLRSIFFNALGSFFGPTQAPKITRGGPNGDIDSAPNQGSFGFDGVGQEISIEDRAARGTWGRGSAITHRFAAGGTGRGFVQQTPALMRHPGGGMLEFAEKKPEAVMPLERMSDGSLGVRANGGGGGPSTINIYQTFTGNVRARDQRLSAKQAAREFQKTTANPR